MMEIQDESRKKLARDLHDGPTQSISAIAMRINFARRLMERDQKSASEELFRSKICTPDNQGNRHMLFTLDHWCSSRRPGCCVQIHGG